MVLPQTLPTPLLLEVRIRLRIRPPRSSKLPTVLFVLLRESLRRVQPTPKSPRP